jgi:hypothetical protein
MIPAEGFIKLRTLCHPYSLHVALEHGVLDDGLKRSRVEM